MKSQRKSTPEHKIHQKKPSDTKDFYKRILCYNKKSLFIRKKSSHRTKDIRDTNDLQGESQDSPFFNYNKE